MHIKGKQYFTTSQFIKECISKDYDMEYMLQGLLDVGIKRPDAMVMIEYVKTKEEC